MRVLFVEPVGTGLPPIGLLYIISSLKKYLGRPVDIDFISIKKSDHPPFERSKEHLLELLNKKPDVCAITATTPVMVNALEVAKLAKKQGCYTVIGGPGATQLSKKIMEKFSYVDMVFRGEAELVAPEIIRRMDDGNFDFSDLKGPIFRKGNKIVETPQHPYIKNLDELPFPDISVLPFDSLHGAFSIITQRGCPYNCSFCFKPVHGQLVRTRSPENIFEEIKEKISQFPKEFEAENRNITIADDTFNIDIARAKKLFDLVINSGLDIKLVAVNGFHVGTVDLELLQKYKQAGGKVLWFGVESGSKKVLAKLNKGITLEKVRESVKIAKQAKIELIGAHFIIGLEDETLETARESIAFAKSLNLDNVGFNHANVLPGTRLWKYATEHGKLLFWTDGIDFSEFQQLHPTPKFETPEFTKEEREKAFEEAIVLMDQVIKRSTLRPKNVLKFVLSLKSPKDFIWALGRVKRYIVTKNLRLNPGKPRPLK